MLHPYYLCENCHNGLEIYWGMLRFGSSGTGS